MQIKTLTSLAILPVVAWMANASFNDKKSTLIISSDTAGYLQGCGCTANQAGGLARRMKIISDLRLAEPNSLYIDLGNLAEEWDLASIILQSLSLNKCDLLISGDNELKNNNYMQLSAAQLNLNYLLPCNFHKSKNFAKSIKLGNFVFINVSNKNITSSRNELQTLLQNVKKSDTVICISRSDTYSEDLLFSGAIADDKIDFIFSNREKRVNGVFNRFIPFPQQNSISKIQFNENYCTVESIDISSNGPVDEKVQKIVEDYYQNLSFSFLNQNNNHTEKFSRTYPSVETCSECHPNEVEKWKSSKHSKAIPTLISKKRIIPQCLTCHSYFFKRTGKFKISNETQDGVECASCHGDGKLHVIFRDKKSIKRTMSSVECQKCHDQKNDPNFVFSTYIKKIKHW
jgi:hypothetical protein